MNCVNTLAGAKIRPVYTVQLSAFSVGPTCGADTGTPHVGAIETII